MKRFFNVFAAFVLIVSTILMSTGFGGKVQAAPIDGLTNVSVQYFDGATSVTEITPATTEVRIKYEFDWGSIDGNGKTVQFQLPSNVFANIQPVAAGTVIATTGNTAVGTYGITAGGQVTLNLNANLQNAKGEVLAIAKINPNYKIENNPQIIELADGKTIALKFNLNNTDEKMGKVDDNKTKITWTVDVNKNLESISNATLSDPITDSDLTIVANSLKVYKLTIGMDGSVTQGAEVTTGITKSTANSTVSVNFGNITSAYRVVFDTTVNAAVFNKTFNNTATFNGKNIPKSVDFIKPIAISKKTTTTAKTPTNTNQSAVDSSNVVAWEITLNKDGALTIPANSILEDTLSFAEGQSARHAEAVMSSVQVLDGATPLTLGTDYTVTHQPTSENHTDKFVIKFLKDFKKELTIKYNSHDSAVANYYSSTANKIENHAKLFNNDSANKQEMSLVNAGKTSYTYSKATTKEFTKHLLNIDYQKQEATYRIYMRVPASGVEKLSVEEYISTEFIDSIHVVKPKITRYAATEPFITETIPGTSIMYLKVANTAIGTELVENTDYTIHNQATDKARYHLYTGNGYTEAGLYQIDLVFPFNADRDKTRNALNNNAAALNNGNYTTTTYSGQSYSYQNNTYMMNNGYKNSSYDVENRKVNWEVGFNYNIRSLTKAVITDTFDDNQELESGSFKLYKWNIGVPYKGSQPASHYVGTKDAVTIDPSTWTNAISANPNGKGFVLDMDELFKDEAFDNILNQDMQAYVLAYTTTFEGDLISKNKYGNTFEIAYDNPIAQLQESEIKGEVTIPRGGDHATKSGAQLSTGSRYVNWSIDINAAQSNVDDLEIYDELSAGQVLLPETVKVYEAKLVVNAGVGTLETQGNALTLDTDYTVIADGNKLTVLIPGKIDEKKSNKSYVIEYQSYVTAANGATISNKLSAKGKNNTIYDSSTGAGDAFAFAFATASGSATTPVPTGDIVITKTAGDTGDVMPGVKFSATFEVDGDSHTLYATTDSDGIATIKDLPAGVIVVVEHETLPGYLLDKTEHKVTVTDGKETPLALTNYPVTPVTLLKFDQDNQAVKLPGAVFTLQKKNAQDEYEYVNANGQFVLEEDKVTWTTSSDSASLGQIKIDTLPYGDYQFVELTPPTGYDAAGPFTFVIDSKKQTVEVSAPNKSSSNGTRVTLTKFNQANANEKLAGAKFKLQKKDGNDYVDVDETGQTVTLETIFITTTDSGQIVIDNLPFGEYQFIETEAPAGYELDETPRQFNLTESKKSANILAPNNKLITVGVITLTKVDAEDLNKRLPNAIFKLKQEQNGAYVDVADNESLVTDGNGQIVIKDLPFGNYQLIEKAAPAGYNKDETPVEFTLSAVKLADSKTMSNKQTPKQPGSIEILKLDGNDRTKPLQGAEFDLILADGTIVKVGPTDAFGKATVDTVQVGIHQLKETKAPAGYVLNTNALAITVTEGAKTTQTVTNFAEPQPLGSLQLTKVDATTKGKLAGAEFLISNGSVSYKVGPTGNDGMATLGNLPVGTYTLIETKAPLGYELNTQEIVVTIAKDQTTPITVENMKQPTTGDLKILKVDAANKNVGLAGAVFTISDGETTKTVTSNNAGEATLTDLVAGTYVVTEMQAPTGYVLNSTPKIVKVEASKTATLTFENVKEIELGGLQVTKVDRANSNTKLAGAQFDLILADGTVLKLGPTDTNGVAKLDNIPVGTHTLKETVAPAGYTLSAEEITVTIGKNTTATVTVRNDKEIPTTGILRLTKVDAADSSIRLGGATFTLTNGDQTQTIMTDASGLALVTDLEPGNYILTETVAPAGYQLNEKSVFVTIRANEITEYTFSNTKKPVTPTPNPNEEDPNSGTNPDGGTNPKPNPDPTQKDPNSLTPAQGTNTGKTPIVTPNYVAGTTGTNTKPTYLPQTNGESTMVYTLLGMLLVVGSAAILFARRRKMN